MGEKRDFKKSLAENQEMQVSTWGELNKEREKRKAMLTICVEETGQVFKIETYRAIPIIEAIGIFCDLKSRGVDRYEDIRGITDILNVLNQAR